MGLIDVLRARLSRTAPTSQDRGRDVDIRPAATQEEVDAIRSLLRREESSPNDVPLPDSVADDSGGLYPVLVGAWRGADLVGAVFVSPDYQEAEELRTRRHCREDADCTLRQVAAINSIAVEPAVRRQGIGLALKLWADAWSADHGAHVMISVPTNDAARKLNQAAGHTVLKPGVALCCRYKKSRHTHTFASDDRTTWAIGFLRQAGDPAIKVGVGITSFRPGKDSRFLWKVITEDDMWRPKSIEG